MRVYRFLLDEQWGMRHPRPPKIELIVVKTTRSKVDFKAMLEEHSSTNDVALKMLRAFEEGHPGLEFARLKMLEVK